MAFPKGNQFWKLRSKHGRDKLFKSPELMWESACEYFQWCIDNPFEEELAFHSQGLITKSSVSKMRPFTLEGVCRYMNASTSYFRSFKCEDRKDKDEFLTVITRIEETIRDQQISGSASGFLNPNIIARYQGLSDKKQIEGNPDKPLQVITGMQIK